MVELDFDIIAYYSVLLIMAHSVVLVYSNSLRPARAGVLSRGKH